ncbi:hypothetical protein ACWIG3_00150 [Streptomyces celluloflavus]
MESELPTSPEYRSAGPWAGRLLLSTRRWGIGLAVAALLCWAAVAVNGFFVELGGGPVRSAAEFHERDARTRQAGGRLGAELRLGKLVDHAADTSVRCTRGLAANGPGEARDEPSYEWEVTFGKRADYVAEVRRLRAEWWERGWRVHDGRSAKGLPVVSGTDDYGIDIGLAIDPGSSRPKIWADGGCIRHHVRDPAATP